MFWGELDDGGGLWGVAGRRFGWGYGVAGGGLVNSAAQL